LGGRAARGERVLGRLFQARERARMSARGRAGAGRSGVEHSEVHPPSIKSGTPAEDQPAERLEPAAASRPSPAPSSDDTLARLREAKKRARREE
jgi:hypothetical protein